MDKEVLEVILKKLDRESRIASILDVKTVGALPKGENYSSTILRMTVKVVLGNGRIAKKSFIMKQMITEGKSGEFIKSFSEASTESQIYSVIHKEMTYLMEEFGDTEEPIWCNFVHYDPKLSCMILEDLKTSGYCLVPRQNGLDLEHSLLALNGLGRYHAMAKVLEERGIVSRENYKPNPLLNDRQIVKCVPYGGMLNMSKAIQEHWDPSWHEIAKKLKTIACDSLIERWCSMGKLYYETEFTVLNHGDCWSNNIMFKYDFQKRPIVVKFLDYQVPHYNTPCIDITNLFYLGVQPEVRRSNYELLIKTYHESLIRSLDKFGYSGRKPSLDEISATMKRLEFFGLTFFVADYCCVMCTATDAFDMEKLMQTDGKEGYSSEILKEPGMVEKLGPDILDYIEKIYSPNDK